MEGHLRVLLVLSRPFLPRRLYVLWMPADIVECTYLTARTAGDDDCQPDLCEQLIGPVSWDFADVKRMEPGLAPEMLHLQVVHPLVGIARGRYFGKRRKA